MALVQKHAVLHIILFHHHPVMLTDSHQLYRETCLATGRAEDSPPVQKVRGDQRCFTGSVRLDQHKVNWITHRQHGRCIYHLASISCNNRNKCQKTKKQRQTSDD